MLRTKASASVVSVAPPIQPLALTSPSVPESVSVPAIVVAPIKNASRPRLAVVKPIAPPVPVEASPEIVAEPEPMEEVDVDPSEKKSPMKVVRAIKWLNPFRKKPETESQK